MRVIYIRNFSAFIKKSTTILIFFITFSSSATHTLAQSITIISPNGGEIWKANSTQIINWESENISQVTIEYSLDNGLSWGIITSSLDASSGKFFWTAKDVNTPYVLIRISDVSNAFVYDISKNSFSIIQESQPAKLNGTAIKIMPLGDSITWGVNPDDENSPGYRRTLDSLLTVAGYNFDFVGSLNGGEPNDFDRDNEGHPGWNAYSPTLPNRSLLDSLNKFLSDNPTDIILLHIGTNDLGGGGNSAAVLANEVKNLLDTIYTFDSTITIIIAKIIDRADNLTRHNRTVEFNNTELPNMINSLPIAQKEKIIVVDMYNALGVYWNNFSNPNFTYQTGPDSNLYMLHPNTNGYLVMANVWFDSLINILPTTIYADLKIFLEGPFDSDSMRTSLNSGGYIPASQPYNISPWNYEGTESVVNIPSGVVDWVLVELRTGTTANTTVASRAGFLMSDGSIVELDGISPVSFNISPNNYYIVINHRNHLAVMSSGTVAIDPNEPPTEYDFTTGQEKAFSLENNNAMVGLGSGGTAPFGLRSGNGNYSVDYVIDGSDYSVVFSQFFQTGYESGDYNLDNIVNGSDYSLVFSNFFKFSYVPN